MLKFQKNKIRVGDKVYILSGNDKGKSGKVLQFDRKNGKVKVEGIKIMVHANEKKKGKTGFIRAEGFINVSKVKLFYESNKVIDEPKKVLDESNKSKNDESNKKGE